MLWNYSQSIDKARVRISCIQVVCLDYCSLCKHVSDDKIIEIRFDKAHVSNKTCYRYLLRSLTEWVCHWFHLHFSTYLEYVLKYLFFRSNAIFLSLQRYFYFHTYFAWVIAAANVNNSSSSWKKMCVWKRFYLLSSTSFSIWVYIGLWPIRIRFSDTVGTFLFLFCCYPFFIAFYLFWCSVFRM